MTMTDERFLASCSQASEKSLRILLSAFGETKGSVFFLATSRR